MRKSNLPLTRTCTSCGLEKPLSAFILKSGTLGSTYGSICVTCRADNAEKKPVIEEEGTTSNVAAGLGYGTKEQSDIEKSKFQKMVNEEYHRERDEAATEELKNLEKTEKIATDEKKHRATFLEKRSVLTNRFENNQSQTGLNPSEMNTQNQINANKVESDKMNLNKTDNDKRSMAMENEKRLDATSQDERNKMNAQNKTNTQMMQQNREGIFSQQQPNTKQVTDKKHQHTFLERRLFLTTAAATATATAAIHHVKKQKTVSDGNLKKTQMQKKEQQSKSLFANKNLLTKAEQAQKRQQKEKQQKEKDLADYVKNTWSPRKR